MAELVSVPLEKREDLVIKGAIEKALNGKTQKRSLFEQYK
jgi:hypothetical protein